jgi:L-histidine N-alpha-methyltransferase
MTSVHRAPDHALSDLRRDVRDGMRQRQKEIPPRYFYDQRGSELFEEITRLPEYYLTRAERGLLERHAPAAIASTGSRTLVEFGAGSGEKTRILIDALHRPDRPLTWVPVDLSDEFLEASSGRIAGEYAGLRVRPIIGDITRPIPLPADLSVPRLFAFLGSTIGNFDDPTATSMLRSMRSSMMEEDSLLLGADLHKDAQTIENAYNDSAGVTAEFNRNVLRVINRELGASFPVEDFEHVAFYNAGEHQIEMHLASRRERTVPIPGVGDVRFERGETIRTEISRKYDPSAIRQLLSAAGLVVTEWMIDPAHCYALVLARPA